MSHWYHGTLSKTTSWSPYKGQSDAEDMLFLSKSVNVAARYGSVFKTSFSKLVPTISVEDWFKERFPKKGSFIIKTDKGYDFPVDTLVAREALPPLSRISDDEITLLDDGFAYNHEPKSVSDRQFKVYIDEHCEGDINQWQNSVFQ